MTVQQRIASDPAHSVWVAANAGSGKTRVLTDRVLRMLLKGIAPHRILCLTYTKAAAAEMSLRIQKQLAQWVTVPEEELAKNLYALLGRVAEAEELTRARRLFAQVVDEPAGMHIQTIHALCQSLLRRFSVEAGVSPHFRLIDDREAQALMEEAKEHLFLTHRLHEDKALLVEAIQQVAATISEQSFYTVLKEIITHRGKFSALIQDGLEDYRQRLAQTLGLDYPPIAEAECAKQYFRYGDQEIAQLRQVLHLMQVSDKPTDQNRGAKLAVWLDCYADYDATRLELWLGALLKEDGEPRVVGHHTFMTAAVTRKCPQAVEWMQREVDRASAYVRHRAALRTARLSESIWHIAKALLEFYYHLKQRRGALDYEDLILLTRDLLNRPGIAPWVLYKLDGGIDHLLVDEAQDTSRIQWQIIEAIAAEFFAGESAGRKNRSLFVVGDEKQSIYSFQGAEPQAFAEMKQYFAQRIQAAEKPYEAVNLSLSFRSSAAVLSAVDAVFAQPEARDGVLITGSDILHQAHRHAPGRVECWPLFKTEEKAEREAWTIPEVQIMPELPDRKLAIKIADTIAGWLAEGRLLVGQGREVQPGDILILVRRRNRFYSFLNAALKQRGIPVAGADRLKLSDHIAVEDMLALAQFLLLPEDDLNLACLLKSPLYGMSEEELFRICHDRNATLWETVCSRNHPAAASLASLLSQVDYLPPFELFSQVLEAEGGRRKFIARLGEEAQDPLNEFLSLALHYEQLHQPSLQGFVHWFSQVETEIKRDMDKSTGQVRVLTVHGAKGLEAPIVFLPDTTGLPTMTERLFLQDQTGVFLWSYRAAEDAEALRILKECKKQEAMQEYRRLLYVAMTRAADELYICGYQSGRNLDPQSWYALMHRGMAPIAEIIEEETLLIEETPKDFRIEKVIPLKECQKAVELPKWIWESAPAEPLPPRPLTPSRPESEEPVADSARAAQRSIQRGKIIHSLLEILPDMAAEQRVKAAEILLQREKISEKDILLREVLEVLNHPDFAPVFGCGSLAEVPISASLMREGIPRILTGQIDRLLVTPSQILVLDYKTNRRVPSSEQEIPLRYRHQLQNYAEALCQIYSGREVRAAILWTSVPRLMPVQLTNS